MPLTVSESPRSSGCIASALALAREAPLVVPRALLRTRSQLRLLTVAAQLLAARMAPNPGAAMPSATASLPPPTASARRVEPDEPTTEPIAEARPAVAGLAIHGYDSLSASQVIPRLEGLTTAELDEVRRYEEANRGRRTILHKITQLRAG